MKDPRSTALWSSHATVLYRTDARRIVSNPSLYHALRARLEKYGDDVRRIVPCTVPVCYRPICRKVVSAGAATAAGWSQGAGCLDSYLRMLSSRSATAVNGSQLAR